MNSSSWLLLALLLLIALAAPRYGVDSRDGSLWNPRPGPHEPPPPPMNPQRRSTPAADLAMLGRLLRRHVLRRPAPVRSGAAARAATRRG